MQFVKQRVFHCFKSSNIRQFRRFSVNLENIGHVIPNLSVSNSKEINLSDAQIHQFINIASQNVNAMLENSLKLENQQRLVVIYDKDYPLTLILAEAYARKRKDCTLIEFGSKSPDEIKKTIDELTPGDLVAMIQTSAFYLDKYRFRLQLFNRNLKAIEHVHLSLFPQEQFLTYLESLAFSPTSKEAQLAHSIKQKIDSAKKIVVKCDGTELIYDTPMEPCVLNIGDYTGMKNIGGTFPVGEVFSEPKTLESVNGEVMVFGFPNPQKSIEISSPFKVTIEKGIISKVAPNAPKTFQEILDIIKEAEKEVIVREFGIGLNKYMGKMKPLNDVTAFERQYGLHVSLGKKHNVFKKATIPKNMRFHIDMFVDVKQIFVDDEMIVNLI